MGKIWVSQVVQNTTGKTGGFREKKKAWDEKRWR